MPVIPVFAREFVRAAPRSRRAAARSLARVAGSILLAVTRPSILALALSLVAVLALILLLRGTGGGPADVPAPQADPRVPAVAPDPDPAPRPEPPAPADDAAGEAPSDPLASDVIDTTAAPWNVALRVVADDDGIPVAGAHVTFTLRFPDPGDPDDGKERAADTDADGAAELSLSHASYSISVRREGFATWFAYSGDVDLGRPVELERAPPLRGRVTDRVSGSPVARATVVAHADDDRMRRLDVEQVTGSDGAFVVAGVAPGTPVLIEVRADGFAPEALTLPAASVAGPVEVRIGGRARVAGRVSDAAGAPVAGAEVAVLAVGRAAPWDQDPRTLREWADPLVRATMMAVTDTAGAFTVSGLAAGSDMVAWARATDATGAMAFGVSPTVTTGDGVETRADVRVAAAGTIAVRLTGAPELLGSVRTGDVTRDGGRRDVPEAFEAEGDDGQWTFTDVPAGRHAVYVEGGAHLPVRVVVTVPPGGAVEAAIELVAGLELSGSVLRGDGRPLAGVFAEWLCPESESHPEFDVLEPTNAEGAFTLSRLPDAPGTLRIVDGGAELLRQDGVRPGQDLGRIEIARAPRVVARLAEDLPMGATAGVVWTDGNTASRKLTSLAKGAEIDFEVPAGERVHVYVLAPGSPAWIRRDVHARDGDAIDLGEVRFPEGAQLDGVVTRDDGTGIANALVFASEPWYTATCQTDAQGRFAFDGVPPGRMAFVVEVNGVMRAYHRVDVEPGRQSVKFPVKDQGDVTIHVKDADGRAVAGLELSFFPVVADDRPDRARAITLKTDSAGNARVSALAGRYLAEPTEGSGRQLARPAPVIEVKAEGKPSVELIVR